MRIETVEEGDIVVRGTEEEGIVHMALRGSQAELIVECLKRGGLRHRVGHIEVRGHATGSSRLALGVDVGLFSESWLTKMHMIVNDAWQYVTP